MVVYPHHGAGRILDIVEQGEGDERRSCYFIEMMHDDMTITSPRGGLGEDRHKADHLGGGGDEVLGVLREDATHMPDNWNHRIRHNRDKIKTGDVLEIADVLRNLALRDYDKGLSTGEKQMYVKVRRILASELMYAKGLGEEKALDLLDGILAEMCAQAARKSSRGLRSQAIDGPRGRRGRLRAGLAYLPDDGLGAFGHGLLVVWSCWAG